MIWRIREQFTLSDFEKQVGVDVPHKSLRYFYWRYFAPFCINMDLGIYDIFRDYAEKPGAMPHNDPSLDPRSAHLVKNFSFEIAQDIFLYGGQLAWLQGMSAYMRKTPPEQMEVDQQAISQAPSYQSAIQDTREAYQVGIKPTCPPDLVQKVDEYFSDWPIYLHRYNRLMYMGGYLLAFHINEPEQSLPPEVESHFRQTCDLLAHSSYSPEKLLDAKAYDDVIFWFEPALIAKPSPDSNFNSQLEDLFLSIPSDCTRYPACKLAWLQGMMAYIHHTPPEQLLLDEASIRQSRPFQSGIQKARELYSQAQSQLSSEELATLREHLSDLPEYIHKNNLMFYVVGYLTALNIVEPKAPIPEDVESVLSRMYLEATQTEELYGKQCNVPEYAAHTHIPVSNIRRHLELGHFHTARQVADIWYISQSEPHPTLPPGHVPVHTYAAKTGHTTAEVLGHVAQGTLKTHRHEFGQDFLSLDEPYPDEPLEYVPFREYAKLRGCSPSAVYDRAQKDLYHSARWIGGQLFLSKGERNPLWANMDDLMPIEAYCEQHGLSKKQLIRYNQLGLWPGVYKVKGRWYISKREHFLD